MEDAVSEARQFLNDCYAALPENTSTPLTINPPLDAGEAEDFLSGLQSGLFSVDPDGYVQSEVLAAAPTNKNRQEIVQLFWHGKGKRFLFREGVCQLAAVSALVQTHGWPASHVRLEPVTGDIGDVAFGVDIVVRSPADGSISICGEAKRNVVELGRLLDELMDCLRDGPHSKSDCKRKNHPKAEALWSLRPDYFWAVCPGKRLAFRVQYAGETVRLEEIPSLPQGSR